MSRLVLNIDQFTRILLLLVTFPLLSNSKLNRRNSFDQVSHKGVFIQLPHANPPTVRPPPYVDSFEKCPDVNQRENWVDTLCGDLNKGTVPLNPLGQGFGDDGSSYPFELIKNKTLQFFRHALPVLRNDKSLPKVARYSPYDLRHHQNRHHRSKRSTLTTLEPSTVNDKNHDGANLTLALQNSSENAFQARSVQAQWQKNLAMSASRFCSTAQPKGSIICNLYNVMWGKPKPATAKQMQLHQHRQGVNRIQVNQGQGHSSHKTPEHYQFAESKDIPASISAENSVSSPATPCTSSVEYLTPVFARNHEGAWRYVVQIPREGYFTQTVEVTKCVEVQCHFMEGSCLTSPRWQSLLVAEMFYPHASFPVAVNSGNTLKRTGAGNSKEDAQKNPEIPSECDGVDEIGCFQVRLFYDWFLIPGSCKCWKRPFDFARFRTSR